MPNKQSLLRIPFVWELAKRHLATHWKDMALIEIEGEFYYNELKTDTKRSFILTYGTNLMPF